jgi:hypothetical protein
MGRVVGAVLLPLLWWLPINGQSWLRWAFLVAGLCALPAAIRLSSLVVSYTNPGPSCARFCRAVPVLLALGYHIIFVQSS